MPELLEDNFKINNFGLNGRIAQKSIDEFKKIENENWELPSLKLNY